MLKLVKKQREEQAEAEVDKKKADIDSINSPICTCGSSMLMTFSHAHSILLCECKAIVRVTGVLR